MKDLEVNFTVNESHIKKQNENIGDIQEEIKEVLDKLQLDVLENKNKKLVERINYIEDTISKFNEDKQHTAVLSFPSLSIPVGKVISLQRFEVFTFRPASL